MSTKLYERFISDLKLKGYAKRSIDSYVKSARQLQRFCNKPLTSIRAGDLREYWLTCRTEYGWSDARIVAYDGKSVTFKWQKVGSSRWRKTTLPVMEFMRRYLQHVLPCGFMRVRHYGFLSHSVSVSIEKIREFIVALGERFSRVRTKVEAPKPFKPLLCPKCHGLMVWSHFVPPGRAVIT